MMRDEASTVRTNSSRQRIRALPLPLAAAILCAAGCAKPDFQAAQQNRGNLRPVTDAGLANAPEEKPPKILPETHFAAGLLFERQGQFDKAIFQYRKAVALNSHYVVAMHRLGRLQCATGQHDEAAQTLQRAVALRPDNAVLHNDLGFECMHTQQWEDAERELRRAVELQTDLATAHINLGLVYAKAGRFDESLASFQAVLPDADAYYNLGLMYQGQQRYAEARETFHHVLTIDPKFSAAKIQLERLAPRAEVPKSAEDVEVVAETPALERVDDQVPVATVDASPLITGPEFLEERHAVECKHGSGAQLADLAAMLTIVDAYKNRARPVDPPAADNPSPVGSSDDEEAVGDAPEKEYIEEGSQDSLNSAAGQVLVDGPSDEESNTPPVVISAEDAVVASDEFEYEAPAVAGFVEGAPVLIETVQTAEPPAPCNAESEEADAGEMIAALPPAPTTQPIRARNSWTMIRELEAKVAMLRSESQATGKKSLASATRP